MLRKKLFRLLLFVTFVFQAPIAFAESCDRASFGSFKQKDYKDTRFRVLYSHKTGPISFLSRPGRKNIMLSGSWVDKYTGKAFFSIAARKIHIDHIIPVCWAWHHGASQWSREKKREFYNDQSFLIPVEAGLNKSKGAKGLDEFVPYNRAFACEYSELFLAGIAKYGLILSPKETAAYSEQRDLACGTPGTEVLALSSSNGS